MNDDDELGRGGGATDCPGRRKRWSLNLLFLIISDSERLTQKAWIFFLIYRHLDKISHRPKAFHRSLLEQHCTNNNNGGYGKEAAHHAIILVRSRCHKSHCSRTWHSVNGTLNVPPYQYCIALAITSSACNNLATNREINWESRVTWMLGLQYSRHQLYSVGRKYGTRTIQQNFFVRKEKHCDRLTVITFQRGYTSRRTRVRIW